MANILDYIKWRGDLLFTQDSSNVLDAVVFSALSYLRFHDILASKSTVPVTLRNAAELFFLTEDYEKRARNKNDLELLRLAAESERFGNAELVLYTDQFVPEEDTQFAALTFLLDDGTIMIAFRGTDDTLVGWKEDFNMSFQQTVPAQRLALQYVHEILSIYDCPVRICGHSKGGNLAVFSAARTSPMFRSRILDVYNFDGPGFSSYMMGDPGYLAMVPVIHTYVPQSSVIGLIMEREEPFMIVKSTAMGGLMQHDTFSWEVMGKAPVPADDLSSESRFVEQMLKNWLYAMNHESRNQMVDMLFGFLESGNVTTTEDLLQLKTWISYLKTIRTDETTRKMLAEQLSGLLEAAKKSRLSLEEKRSIPEELPESGILDSVE